MPSSSVLAVVHLLFHEIASLRPRTAATALSRCHSTLRALLCPHPKKPYHALIRQRTISPSFRPSCGRPAQRSQGPPPCTLRCEIRTGSQPTLTSTLPLARGSLSLTGSRGTRATASSPTARRASSDNPRLSPSPKTRFSTDSPSSLIAQIPAHVLLRHPEISVRHERRTNLPRVQAAPPLPFLRD
ncbi:hypothetical protein FB451DRAFT_1243263 [Mycena latifolia]|nr:hypothetical protein FB451DRAFT_1243263 [Mycena latifolia]